ncbi:MAG: ribosome-associated translation inhibitor RaiA [Candidatus Omnitrophica bacterium]|nr:ribosome-associated translation inhibitor RaiA [Candidatus Omnitrophota bacterium]MDD5487598.1 ribosome-associated translation inhibitor RaiA [Candidatus Omnitrophota bacterium]
MNVSITGRNIELNDSLKKYINNKMAKIEKFYNRINGCDVILDAEKTLKTIEIIVYLKRNRIVAREAATDIYASVDKAGDNIKKQLRRLRGKAASRRRKAVMGKIMDMGKWGK